MLTALLGVKYNVCNAVLPVSDPGAYLGGLYGFKPPK